MRSKALWLLAAVVVLSFPLLVPANAFDQGVNGKGIELSLDKTAPCAENDGNPRTCQQTFLQMAAQDPVGLYGVDECRALNSCDTIPFVLDIPDKFIHLTILTLTFDHAAPPEPVGGPGANDLDMFIYEWNGKKNTDGTPKYDSVGSAASQSQPEIFKVADIQARKADNPYWIVIVNFTGSTAYGIRAELRPQTFDDSFSRGTAPRPRQITPTTVAPKPTSKTGFDGNLPTVTQAEEDKLPSVKEPGADGELAELPLVAIRGQARELAAPNRKPLIIATIVLLALAGATFGFFFIRSRRAAAEETAA